MSYAAAFWILSRFFRRSVLYQIGLYWVFTLVWIMFALQIRNAFFRESTVAYIITLALNVAVCLIVFYIAAQKVANPLGRLVKIIMKLSNGDLEKPDLTGLSLKEGRDFGGFAYRDYANARVPRVGDLLFESADTRYG